MNNAGADILVSVSCITYNHSKFIRQCLDGMLMQQVNFKFEILIHDDASNDGTQDIIKEYQANHPSIIKPIFRENNLYSQGVRFINKFNFERAKGKYIALCEGDDYWQDPFKLQKQVDILEKNNEIGLVYTNCERLNGTYKYCNRSYQINSFNQLLFDNPISTLTTCYRKSLLDEYLISAADYFSSDFFGDYQQWLYYSLHSKLYFLEDITSVYRVLEESASHSKDINKRIYFVQDVYRIRNLFINRFVVNESSKKDLLLKSKACLLSNINALYLFHNRHDLFLKSYSEIGTISFLNKKYSIFLRIGYTKIGWSLLQVIYKIRFKIKSIKFT